MDYNIDFSTYSLEELYSSAAAIDRKRFPERASEIDARIREKEQSLPASAETASYIGQNASRYDRLLAVLVDTVIQFVFSLPFILYLGWGALMEPTLAIALIAIAHGVLLTAALQGYLLYKYGQTIGKRLMSIRIENLDGTKANLKTIVLKRMLPMGALFYVPYAGLIVVGLVNPLMIFGKQRRCLHDHIAKTKVSYTSN